ncbi:MAG: signal recognition particle-docking protein FtsY [Parvularculaceae bacterium]
MTKTKNFLTGLFSKRQGEDAREDAPTPSEQPPEIVQPTDVSPARDVEEMPIKQGFFARLASGLARSSQRFSDGVVAIVAKRKLDDETLDELEEALIASDLGVAAAGRVRAALARDRFNKEVTDEELRAALADAVATSLKPHEKPFAVDRTRAPHVILAVGVNGAGKTTTIGKLAEKFRKDGLRVMLAAGDTFRAAAVEQLKVWGERAGAPVVSKPTGADAAGLAFEALERAKSEGFDVLIIDTAGRLQNRRELMDELAKIVRVLKKLDPAAPHDTLLVLDATVGQNAISQADAFREIAGVTGLVMTKLDGTARGGVLVALADKHALPIHFVGVGEGVEDLQPFDALGFSRALAGLSPENGNG